MPRRPGSYKRCSLTEHAPIPPAPPSSAAAAAAQLSTTHPPSDVRDLSGHGIKDGHRVAKQSKASAPLRFVIESALADLLARLAMRKAGRKRHQPKLLTNRRGAATTQITLRRHFEDAPTSAAAAAPKRGK